MAGRPVTGAGRHGKFLDIGIGGDLHLVVHLARAGWLHYRDAFTAPPRSSRARARSRCGCAWTTASGFDLTEAGTQKSLAAYLVPTRSRCPASPGSGPDALAVDLDDVRRARSAAGAARSRAC